MIQGPICETRKQIITIWSFFLLWFNPSATVTYGFLFTRAAQGSRRPRPGEGAGAGREKQGWLGAGRPAREDERPAGSWAAQQPASSTVTAADNDGDARRRNKRKDGEHVKQ